MSFKPRKIVMFTRPWEVHFHCRLADRLSQQTGCQRILFVSFFRAAIAIAKGHGFDCVYMPDLLRAGPQSLSAHRLKAFDEYCGEHFAGLNVMLGTERFLPSRAAERESFLMDHIAVLEQLIEPCSLTVSSMYDHFFYLAAGLLSFEKGGRHYAFVACGLPANRVIGLKTPWEPWVNPLARNNSEGMLERVQVEVQLPPEQRISYMRTPQIVRSKRFADKLRAVLRRRRDARADLHSGSYFRDSMRSWPMNDVSDFIHKHLSGRRFSNWDIVDEVGLCEIGAPFLFMALHLEPEATVLMYSPLLRDQLEAIRLVAEALPMGYLLLVKDNPKMVGSRSNTFYKELKRFHNVRLIAPFLSTSPIIPRCQAVVSLGGTVTLEAAVQGKAAYCFGTPPFWRFATGSGLDLLGELASERFVGHSVDKSAFMQVWSDWLSSTFDANPIPSIFAVELGHPVVDYSADNVECFVEFIAGCNTIGDPPLTGRATNFYGKGNR